jgi:uncharacterized protein (TIGR02270 family)
MIFWDMVERHLDEAEFMWGMWEHSLVAPDYTLEEVAEGPEQLLLAHIDGLVANGPEVAQRLLNPALDHGAPDLVSAAALAMLQSPGAPGLDAVVVALRTLPQQRAPLKRALACADRPEVLEHMRGLLGSLDEGLVAAAAEVLLFHHAPLGSTLSVLLAGEQSATRILGLRALMGEGDSPQALAAVRAGLADEEPSVATVAMEVGCRFGLDIAWARARERAAGGDKEAMLLLALGGGAAEHKGLLAALSDAARRPSALWALGFVGTPEAVDASLEWLNDPQAGHLVGEVFSAVTGVALATMGMTAAPGEEERLERTAEGELSRPDPAAVRGWWMKHRGAFTPGTRYLMGKPRSWEGLLEALARGPMRRRPPLLLDLQLRAPARPGPRLQPRAPTRRQFAELAALRALPDTAFNVTSPLL